MMQEFDSSETNDRLEESCSCDLNSIDNTESDGSPAIVKSRSETLDTMQSCEVVSLDSRLSDKPETPTTARDTHTETPTILEEANSEAVSLPTTQETSEVISIESSSDFYSEVHKIESSSPDSMIVQETLKKEEDTVLEKQSVAVTESTSTEQIKESTEATAVESNDSKETVTDTNIPDTVSATVDKVENPSIADEEAKDKSVEENNVTTDDSNTPTNTEDSDKTATVIENTTEPVASKADAEADTEEDTVPIVPSDETREPLTIKVIEKLQLENDREIIDSDTSEAYLTPTENQEITSEIKSRTTEDEKIDDDTVEKKDISEDGDITAETGENDTGETVKNPNCSTSIVESGVACAEKAVDLGSEKVEPVIVNSALNSDERTVDSLTEDKSAVINDNEDAKVNEKHSREPSTISTSVSDNKSDVPEATDAVEVTDSVCSNSDVQSSVDNVTQVPNPKQQIPTISTVCDATKSLSDGVPQIVSSNVVARDNALLNDLTPDHVDTHRRSSLPIVSSETVADDNGHEPPSLPVPLRKTSSPQKRPRSASTSTQVDPNHFGEFENRNPFINEIVSILFYFYVFFLSQKLKERSKEIPPRGRCSVQARHDLHSEYRNLNGHTYINGCCRTFYSLWKQTFKCGEGMNRICNVACICIDDMSIFYSNYCVTVTQQSPCWIS